MKPCGFCAIVNSEGDAVMVGEDSAGLAFLDVRPVFKGHVLVIPREHLAVVTDLPPAAVGPFFRLVQRVARAVEVGLGAGGSFVAINNRVSQSVPHLHVHVIPRTKGDGLRGFFWPRRRYESPKEAVAYAERIRAAW